MANILRLYAEPPSKFGFERVKKRKKREVTPKGQLNLFSSRAGHVVQLPADLSPFEEALLLDERGDGRASELYWEAISQADSAADAYCNLGILESQAGKTIRAFDCFTNSLKLDPRHFESHFNLANLYFDAGDKRQARLHYELAAEIEPDFPNIYFNLGLVHAMNEDFKNALRTLRKYKKLAPAEEGHKADQLLASLEGSMAARH